MSKMFDVVFQEYAENFNRTGEIAADIMKIAAIRELNETIGALNKKW